jgi:uncharacterized repeat protein (TIGR02543 family)
MSPTIHTYDQAKNLTATTFSRTGYSFGGWNTAANGSGAAYANEASVVNLSSVDGSTATLYAQWTVNAFDLTSFVTAPVTGAAPVTTAIDAAQYTGAISWKKWDGTSSTNFSGNFAPSTVYQAMVSLTAKTGFTFTGVNANSFIYTGTTATNPAGSRNTITVTITFPATAAVVTNLDLTMPVTAPVKNAPPNTTGISDTQYTGTVTWEKADGTNVTGNFAPATIYQATVSLLAETGYTFTGVNTDSFAHDHAAAVTNATGSGDTMTVTVVFPVTGDQIITLIFNDDGEGAFSQTEFTLSKPASESQLVTISGSGYANPRWFVDGDLKETATSITINAVDYSVGKHNLTLLISKGGVSWSKEIPFTVTN